MRRIHTAARFEFGGARPTSCPNTHRAPTFSGDGRRDIWPSRQVYSPPGGPANKSVTSCQERRSPTPKSLQRISSKKSPRHQIPASQIPYLSLRRGKCQCNAAAVQSLPNGRSPACNRPEVPALDSINPLAPPAGQPRSSGLHLRPVGRMQPMYPSG